MQITNWPKLKRIRVEIIVQKFTLRLLYLDKIRFSIRVSEIRNRV